MCKCKKDGCKVRAAFNKPDEMKALYCFSHKEDNMVNVVSKSCLYEGCRVQPNYNKEGETKPLYCSTHKLDGMVDVKSKRCIHSGCKTIPNYNNEGEKIALYCVAHKLDGMIDIRHKRCKTHLCYTRVSEKYDGYCLYCYINLFPDKPVSRNYKTKEYSVVEYVKTKFNNLDWVADKVITGGCSKRRPDLLLDLIYHVIIIEIDENQHIDYVNICENKRIMELSQDLGHRPIIFIRFNPDDYIKNGKNISSCWGMDKKGMCVVKKSKKTEWDSRLNLLEEKIKYWTNPLNISSKLIETEKLFYDE